MLPLLPLFFFLFVKQLRRQLGEARRESRDLRVLNDQVSNINVRHRYVSLPVCCCLPTICTVCNLNFLRCLSLSPPPPPPPRVLSLFFLPRLSLSLPPFVSFLLSLSFYLSPGFYPSLPLPCPLSLSLTCSVILAFYFSLFLLLSFSVTLTLLCVSLFLSSQTVETGAWWSDENITRLPECTRPGKAFSQHFFKLNCLFFFGTVIAQIFVRDLISYISYFWRKVRNLVAYENHTRIQVYLTPPSLYENF